MSEKAIKASFCDCRSNGGVVDFLASVHFVSSGVAGGVVMAEVPVVFLDRPDEVPFHDLHVVDVVEQFEVIGSDHVHQLDPPVRSIAHVVGMVDPAVEEFHVEDDPMLFGDGDDLLESSSAVFQASLSIDAPCVSRKANDIPPAFLGRGFNSLLKRFQAALVELRFAKPVGKSVGLNHGAYQPMFFHRFKVFRTEQVDSGESHLDCLLAEFVERLFGEAPSAYGLANPAGLAGRGSGLDGGWSAGDGGCSCHGDADKVPAFHLDLPFQWVGTKEG